MIKDKKKKVFLSFLLLLLFSVVPQNIFAICPYEYKTKYKKMATNVNYDLSYIEKSGEAIFKVRFTNVSKELILVDASTGKEYSPNGNKEIIIDNLMSGTQYNFIIKTSHNVENGSKVIYIMVDGKKVPGYTIGSDQDCTNINLQKFYITTPSYNKYYTDKLCEGLREHQLCNKWNKNNYNYEEFKTEIEKIKVSDSEEKTEKVEEKKNKFIDIVRNNFYLIVIGMIMLLGIMYYIYQKKKGDDFEGW